MTLRTAPSPAWLGLFALATFAGLVVASFASGFHLVMKAPPPAAPGADTVAPAGGASAQSAAGKLESQATSLAPSDPAEAIVRQNLTPDRALVRSQPETGSIVSRLPSNQRVTLRGRSGEWLRIEYERNGKRVLGWTPESNLILR